MPEGQYFASVLLFTIYVTFRVITTFLLDSGDGRAVVRAAIWFLNEMVNSAGRKRFLNGKFRLGAGSNAILISNGTNNALFELQNGCHVVKYLRSVELNHHQFCC